MPRGHCQSYQPVYYQPCQPVYYQPCQPYQPVTSDTYTHQQSTVIAKPSNLQISKASDPQTYSSVITFTVPTGSTIPIKYSGSWEDGSKTSGDWDATLNGNSVSIQNSAVYIIREKDKNGNDKVIIGIKKGFTGTFKIGDQIISSEIPKISLVEPKLADPVQTPTTTIPDHTVKIGSEPQSIFPKESTNIPNTITHVRLKPNGPLTAIPEEGLDVGGARIFRNGTVQYSGGADLPSTPITIFNGKAPILNLTIKEKELK